MSQSSIYRIDSIDEISICTAHHKAPTPNASYWIDRQSLEQTETLLRHQKSSPDHIYPVPVYAATMQ